MSTPTIAWSDFARQRHRKGTSYSYFVGEESELINLIKIYWNKRVPGQGEQDLSRKVVVPLLPSKELSNFLAEDLSKMFRGSSAKIKKGMKIKASVGQRQEGEDLFIATRLKKSWYRKLLEKLTGNDGMESPQFVSVVLYSREALLENDGEVSSDAEWEIVAIICSDVEKEPMRPLTMARNMLQKAGGTKSTYTAEEFAESIYYWSQRVSIEG